MFWILFAIIFLSSLSASEAEERNRIVLLSCDGFRYDYLNRGITPALDSIASAGARALALEPVFPTASFPGNYSIITGLYPENHGIIANNFYDKISEETYSATDDDTRSNPKWYRGETVWQTAKRSGINSAAVQWPGSDIEAEYMQPKYFKGLDDDISDKEIFEIALHWLQSEEKRPSFISIKFDNIDKAGHLNGTNSPELNDAIIEFDELIGGFCKKLNKLDGAENINLIIVSPYGMSVADSGLVDLSGYLDDDKLIVQNYGAYMMIDSKENDMAAIKQLYEELKSNEVNYKVYLKDEIPERLHFSSYAFISPIVVFADRHYLIASGKNTGQAEIKAAHGYMPDNIDMQGIFLASGPDFKTGYSCPSLKCVDIYKILCRLLKINPVNNTDSDLNRIQNILINKE